MYLHFCETDLVYTKVDMEFYMITLQIEAKPGSSLEIDKRISGYKHCVTNAKYKTLEGIKKHCDDIMQAKHRHCEIGNILSDDELKNLFGNYYANNYKNINDHNIENNWIEESQIVYKFRAKKYSGIFETTDIEYLIEEYRNYIDIKVIG